MSKPILFGYYRSSAAYRVRIALAWKGVSYDTKPVHLVKGEHRAADYLDINPQGQVPSLLIDGHTLAQSMAILEYLEETRPEPPLLPQDPAARAVVRWMAQLIVADIHPINNLRIGNYLRSSFGQGDDGVQAWMRHWMGEGFRALEKLVAVHGGDYCHGNAPTLADVCLVPQMYNARRFALDLAEFPALTAIEERCRTLLPFVAAHPDRQVDCPVS